MNQNNLEIARCGRVTSPKTRAAGLKYLILKTPNLTRAAAFFSDFGLQQTSTQAHSVFFRAAGSEPVVLILEAGKKAGLAGIALAVDSEADLRQLAELPEAGPIIDHAAPGGGKCVHLDSPGGTRFIAVCASESIAALPLAAAHPFNGARDQDRLDARVRLPSRPALVEKLGHALVGTTHPVKTVVWLMQTFGMLLSDSQHLEAEPTFPVISFLRFNRGSTPCDHHSIAVGPGLAEGLEHGAYEVDSFDEISTGAQWLTSSGHQHAWGVGRHLLGSQLFNYWRSPDGVVMEHYTDGDLLSEDSPPGFFPLTRENLVQWAPPIPANFISPAFGPGLVVQVMQTLYADNELTLPRLFQLARAL